MEGRRERRWRSYGISGGAGTLGGGAFTGGRGAEGGVGYKLSRGNEGGRGSKGSGDADGCGCWSRGAAALRVVILQEAEELIAVVDAMDVKEVEELKEMAACQGVQLLWEQVGLKEAEELAVAGCT